MSIVFELLPTFTQLQIFGADRLHLPFYEPNTNLPLLCTLRKLQLRACSVRWMAGRQFPCLEECALFLPHHWEEIQQHKVQLPSCKKLAYHDYPMTTAQYFHVPEMRAMDIRSGVWKYVEIDQVWLYYSESEASRSHVFDQTVGHQPCYEKWWESFTVTKRYPRTVTVRASM